MRPADWLGQEGPTRWFAIVRMTTVVLAFLSLHAALALWKLEPDTGLFPLSIAFFFSAWASFAGVFTRVSTAILALSSATVWLYYGEHQGLTLYQDRQSIVIPLIIVALLPSGRSLSFDRWRALRRARAHGRAPPVERGPQWAWPLMRVHLMVTFGAMAWEAATSGHGQYSVMWANIIGTSQAFIPWGEMDLPGVLIQVVMTGGFASVALFAASRRTSKWAGWIGSILTLTVWIAFGNTIVFQLALLIALMGLMSPERFHRACDDVVARDGPPPERVVAPLTPARAGLGLLAAALAGFTLAGPLRGQVMQAQGPPNWNWALFHHIGVGVCELDYRRVVHEPPSQTVKIVRHELLGFESVTDLPRQLRRINVPGVIVDEARVCRAAITKWGRQVDVRLHARCTDGRDWVPSRDGSLNVCGPEHRAAIAAEHRLRAAERRQQVPPLPGAVPTVGGPPASGQRQPVNQRATARPAQPVPSIQPLKAIPIDERDAK